MRYPPAVWRPWFPYTPERYIDPRLVILHTNAVNAEDPGPQGTLSWHFQIGEHGDIYQHRDTNTRAAANADANGFAISIETWDGGDPEGNPWNQSQLDALHELLTWCVDTHGIPPVVPDTWDGAGIGFHRMFRQWNQPVHSCPGNTRALQFLGVLKRLNNEEPDDLTPEEHAQLAAVNAWTGNITPVIQGQTANSLNDPNGGVHVKLDRLTAKVDALELGGIDLDALARKVADLLAERLAS